MKVLFLIQGFSVAASRYRVLQYIPYLNSKGVETSVRLYPRTLKENFNSSTICHSPISFFFKKAIQPTPARIVKEKGKTDHLRLRRLRDVSKLKGPRSDFSDPEKAFCPDDQNSNFVIAGNEFFKEWGVSFNPNVEVIPTAIDQERYHLKTYPLQQDRWPWMDRGPWLHSLFRKNETSLRKDLGSDTLMWTWRLCVTLFSMRAEWEWLRKWSSEEEVADLQGFDFGLMPLVDDPWSWEMWPQDHSVSRVGSR